MLSVLPINFFVLLFTIGSNVKINKPNLSPATIIYISWLLETQMADNLFEFNQFRVIWSKHRRTTRIPEWINIHTNVWKLFSIENSLKCTEVPKSLIKDQKTHWWILHLSFRFSCIRHRSPSHSNLSNRYIYLVFFLFFSNEFWWIGWKIQQSRLQYRFTHCIVLCMHYDNTDWIWFHRIIRESSEWKLLIFLIESSNTIISMNDWKRITYVFSKGVLSEWVLATVFVVFS